MTTFDLLIDAFGRVRGIVHSALRDATNAELTYRPDPDANSVAWLIWHLARVEDRQVADASGTEQVWMSGGWAERFALPFEPEATGYGHTSADVAAVRTDAELLGAYYDAVHERTDAYLAGLGADDLDRIVDRSWNPPVTLGVRLVSTVADVLQHAGQASYVRGLAERSA